MTPFAESYAVWLADYYLLATVLLAMSLTGIALLKQPAQRLMVTKSTLVALVLLAILCALPGWSVVHLLTAEGPTVREELPHGQPMAVSESVSRPNLVQNNSVQRPARPALVTKTANDNLATPNTSNASKMSWPVLLAIAHATGMGCIVVWLTLGWIASVRLRRTVHLAPANVSAILNELASLNRRAPQPTRLFTHDRIDVAVALGVWGPMILLPNHWTSSQSHDRLQAVLAHEATHVLNYDLQWVALARILFVALWANPLFWLTKRRLRLDQEALADAAAAEITSRQQYAEQLVAWARDARSRPALHLSSAVGLWEGPSQLRQRISILLDEQLTVLRNCSRRWRITAGVFAIGAATALSMVTLQPAIRAEEEKTAAKSTPDPFSPESLFKLYRKHFKPGEPNVISGIVVDEKFQPVANAKVQVFRTNWRNITQKLIIEKSTDADGKVRFDQVFDLANEFPGGKIPPIYGIGEEMLQVVVRAPGRVTYSRLQDRPLIAKRGEPLMIIMPPAATLRGRVTGPDGKPAAGALVSAGTGSLAPWAEATSVRTDADGNYTMNDVPPVDLKHNGDEAALKFRASPPSLTLTVEQPGFAVAQQQVEKTPGTADVQLHPAAVLVGRVVFADSGKAAGSTRVWVAGHRQKLSEAKGDLPGDGELRRYTAPFYTVSTLADADGNYRFESLPPGYYHLLAETPGWVSVGIRDVPAVAGKTNEAPNLTLSKGGTVTIRLVDAKTRQPVKVPPEAQAHIGSGERPIYDRPPIEQTIPVNSGGLFELQLPAGKHEIFIGAVYIGEDRKWMSDYATPADNPNAFVTVTDAKTVQVDLTVIDAKSAKITGTFVPGPLPKTQPGTEKKPGETPNDNSKQMSRPRPQSNVVSGQVLDERRQPIAGAQALLFRINRIDASRQLNAKQLTDAQGRFRFEKVIDIAKEFPGGKFPPVDDIGDDLLQVIVVAPNRVPHSWLQVPQRIAQSEEFQVVTLWPSAQLSGRVTNRDGKPIAGALVSVGTGSFDRWEGALSARTDADGKYTINDAPPFDLQQYRDENLTATNGGAGPRNESAATPLFRLSPPVMTVEHPDFATKQTDIEKVPGKKDVQLDPGATITGRVVNGETNQPAVDARVFAAAGLQRFSRASGAFANISAPDVDMGYGYFTTSARTDAEGKYRIPSLPPATYHLWAEAPGQIAAKNVPVAPGKILSISDLVLTKLGTVSVRLVNADTGRPIDAPPGTRAEIYEPNSQRRPDRSGVLIKDGRFELRVAPGAHSFRVGGVDVGHDTLWSGDAISDRKPSAAVNVAAGEKVSVDLPVSAPGQPEAGSPAQNALQAPSVVEQAERLRAEGKPLEAIKLLNATLEKDPENIDALLIRADAWSTAGDNRQSVAEYERALKLKVPRLQKMIAWNNLAFIRATSPDDRMRDGKRAVDMAETAQQLQETPTPDVLDTLAAAYAEDGQFDRAVKTAQEAIKLAPENRREEFRKYLELYEAHKPRRETKPSSEQPTGKKDGASTSSSDEQIARQQPNTVFGHAVTDTSQRIAGAEVFLFRVNQNDGTRKLLAKTSTDADGGFRFESVIDIDKEFPGRKFPGSYEIGNEMLEAAIRAPGRVPATWLMMPQFVAQRGEYHEAKLFSAATLRGRVTNTSGKPVAGAAVSIGGGSISANSAAHWEGAQTIRTNADGYYQIDDMFPFDEADFKKQLTEEDKQRKEAAARGTTTFAMFLSRPILTVEHPDYAVKQTYFNSVPGTTDVHLEPAAVLEGRVVFADSDKRAVGALVGVVTSIERRDPPVLPPQTDLLKRLVRTDANGRYHVGSLPQGKYDLWAQTPGWVNVGTNGVVAVASKTSSVPDLMFTKGGVISARIVDAKTHKPVALPLTARAYLLVREVSSRPTFPQGAEFITLSPDGRFESHSAPGKKLVGVGCVEINGEMKFSGEPTTEVNVVEGKTVTVDLPVTELPSWLPATDPAQPPAQAMPDNKQPPLRGAAPAASPFGASQPAKASGAQATVSTGDKDEIYTVPITVSGQAIDNNEQPIAGARVYLASPRTNSKPLAITISDNDGKYQFEGVRLPIKPEAGKEDIGSIEVFGQATGFGLAWRPLKWFYPKTAHAERWPSIEPGWDLPHSYGTEDPIELDLHFGPAATLRGRIVNDAGEPIADAPLAIRRAQPVSDKIGNFEFESLNESSLVPENIKVRRSDKDGKFEFNELSANVRFWIDVRPPGYTQRGIYAATQTGPQENVDGIPVFGDDFEVVFNRPRSVKLRVVYSDTRQPAPKVGIGGLVTVAGFWETTDENGLVTVPLPDGQYRLGLAPRHGTPYMKSEADVVVSEKSANDVTTLSLQRAAEVDIHVVDADTKEPLSGVDVWIDQQGPGTTEPHRQVHGYRSWEVETRISKYDSPTSDAKGNMHVLFEPGKCRIGVGLQKFPTGYEPVEPNGKLVELESGKPQSFEFQMRKQARP